MAFWRLRTMDSWNPLTWRFWQWGNLFSLSRYEHIEQLKYKIIDKLYQKIKYTHPLQADSKIECPLTHEAITHPVLTEDGQIFDKYALLQRISAYDTIPGCSRKLTAGDVYDFKELDGILKFVKLRHSAYLAKEQELLALAQQALAHRDTRLQYHSVFTCPLSGRLIRSPVITPAGRVYDAEAINGYFETTNKHYDPIDGSPLLPSSLRVFETFADYLSMYRNKPAELSEQAGELMVGTVNSVVKGFEFIGSFFSRPKIKDEQGELIPRPRMDFRL